MFEEGSSTKNSKAEENMTTHGRVTRVHSRAPQAEAAEVGTTSARLAVLGRTTTSTPHARSCVGARATVRLYTGTHTSRHGRASGLLRVFAIFSSFYIRFFFTLGRPLRLL